MPLRDHFRPPLDDVHSWDELHGGWPMMIVQKLVAPEQVDALRGRSYDAPLVTWTPSARQRVRLPRTCFRKGFCAPSVERIPTPFRAQSRTVFSYSAELPELNRRPHDANLPAIGL
jgi:hypothetical protein